MKMFFCSSDMSKSDILRGIITEKLSTAAREILAVLERTVADYEEEASGFRQEIDRQRRQLELLQPQVKLHRGDVEEAESQSLPWSHDGDEDKQPETTSTQKQEDLKDPDDETPSRSDSSGAPSVSRRPGGPEVRDTQNHLGFRVRFLENSQMKVLSTAVFQKCPIQNLLCPRGLQEADFLDLLRSTFPLLANGEPFEILLTSASRKLLPLRAKPLTPEGIYRTIRSSRNSALYIRLKKGEEQEDKKEEEPHVSPRTSDPPSDPELLNKETELQTRSDWSRVPSVRRRPSRPQISDTQNHLDLRIRFLEEDSGMEVLSNAVFQKCPVQNLRCPLGLQEVDFLDLLKSTFPQLANDEPFDIFMAGRKRRLMPVRVKLLTPEEIYTTMKVTGNSSLFIRLKTKEEKQEENEELQDFPRITDPVLLNNGTGLHMSPVDSVEDPRGGDLSNRSGPEQQGLETEEEEAENNVDSSNNGEEALDGDADWTPDPELQTNREPRRKKLKMDVRKTKDGKMSCKVCGVWYCQMGSLIIHTWSHINEQQNVCGVCGEKFESVEELKEHLRNHQDVHICSHCGKTFTSISSLNSHAAKHTGNSQFKCNVCDKTFNNRSALDVHRWVHVEDKPHKCDVCPKAFGVKSQLSTHRKTHTSKDKHVCNVCGKSLTDRRTVARHMLTHSDERRYGCEVCGKRFKLQTTLKTHEMTHKVREQPFLCHICSKTFLSMPGLKAHLQIHSSEKPFVCDVCGKSFPSRGSLTIHIKTHSTERPFECSECGLSFKFKRHLNNHTFTHSGIKKFVCGVCGKASSRQEHLKVHMRTHNGERPYKCTVCEKDFTQSHCLKTHMMSHQTEDNHVPENQTEDNPVPENQTEDNPVPENQTEDNPVPENQTEEKPCP